MREWVARVMTLYGFNYGRARRMFFDRILRPLHFMERAQQVRQDEIGLNVDQDLSVQHAIDEVYAEWMRDGFEVDDESESSEEVNPPDLSEPEIVPQCDVSRDGVPLHLSRSITPQGGKISVPVPSAERIKRYVQSERERCLNDPNYQFGSDSTNYARTVYDAGSDGSDETFLPPSGLEPSLHSIGLSSTDHSVRAMLENFGSLSQHFATSTENRKFIVLAENVIFLVSHVIYDSSSTGVFLALTSFIKCQCGIESIFGQSCDALKVVYDMLRGDEIIPQADDPFEGVTDSVSSVVENWSEMYQSPTARRLANLVSIVSHMGVGSLVADKDVASIIKGSYKGFKWWEILTKDFIPSILQLLLTVLKRVYRAIKERDVGYLWSKPLEGGPSLGERVTLLVKLFDNFKSCTLDRFGKDPIWYQYELSELLREVKERSGKTSSLEAAKHFAIMHKSLLSLNIDVINHMNSLPSRNTPFSFLLFGPSDIGKTTTLPYILNVVHAAMGLDVDPKFTVTLNPRDKYGSEVQGFHHTIILDDIANINPEFDKEANVHHLINDIVNSVPKHVLKADLSEKGTLTYRPEVVVGTTNIKGMNAGVYSAEPASVTRRFPFVITMEVKPEFKQPDSRFLDKDKAFAAQMDVPDFWHCTVESVYGKESIAGKGTQTGYKLCHRVDESGKVMHIHGKPIVLEKVGIAEVMRFLKTQAAIHKRRQERLKSTITNISDIPKCACGIYASICTQCPNIRVESGPVIDLRPQQPDLLSENGRSRMEVFFNNLTLSRRAYRVLRVEWAHRKFSDCQAWVYAMIVAPPIRNILARICGLWFTSNLIAVLTFSFFTSPIVCACAVSGSLAITSSCVFAFGRYLFAGKALGGISRRILASTRLEKWEKPLKVIGACLGVVAGLVALYGVTKVITGAVLDAKDKKKDEATADGKKEKGEKKQQEMKVLEVQDAQPSAYIPRKEPVPELMKSKEPNMWRAEERIYVPFSPSASGTLVEPVMEQMAQNVRRVKIMYANGNWRRAMATPVGRDLWIMPAHMFVGKDYTFAQIHRRGPEFKTIHLAHMVRIPNTDLMLVSIPEIEPKPYMAKYLQQNKIRTYVSGGYILLPDSNDKVRPVSTGKLTYKAVPSTPDIDCPYDGLSYNVVTECGMCSVPVFSSQRHPVIVGFHTAGTGYGEVKTGICCQLTLSQFVVAEQELRSQQLIPTPALEGQAMEISAGKYPSTGTHHDKSEFIWADSTINTIPMGAHGAEKRKFRSIVRKSMLSDAVAEVFKVPREHGPPPFFDHKTWVGTQQNFESLNKAVLLDQHVLDWSVDCFKQKITEHFSKVQPIKVSPMDRVSVLAGIKGVNGMEGLVLSTSSGWPHNCPKTHFITETNSAPRWAKRGLELDSTIWKRIDQMYDQLSRGERVFSVFRANLKDEPVKLTKKKVRMFAGCPIELLILFRMFFMPIFAYMQQHPLVFECVVGVNAYGKSWDEMSEFVTKLSDSNVAGDFESFDKLVTAYEIFCAFAVVFHVLDFIGDDQYTPEVRKVMQTMVSEVAYPVYEWFGSYNMHIGSMPSGFPFTAPLDSIIVSLRIRYAWYKIVVAQRPLSPRFDTQVHLVTYGDDHRMCVADEYPEFNHVSISKVFGDAGIGYTMADKEAESVPFIGNKDTSFLKRYSKYDKDMKVWLAPLEEKSLYKALHCYMPSPAISERERSCQVLRGVLREAFHYGPEQYESYRFKLIEVADKVGLLEELGALPCYAEAQQLFLAARDGAVGVPNVPPCISDSTLSEISCGPLITTQALLCTPVQWNEEALDHKVKGLVPSLYLEESLPDNTGLPGRGHSSNPRSVHSNRTANTRIYNMSVSSGGHHETTSFHDEESQYDIGLVGVKDSIASNVREQELSLSDFFKRPVLIRQYAWTPGTAFNAGTPKAFDPWTDFFSNVRVSNRISNYKNMRCDLKVKFVVNGNSFYYGRLLVAYIPFIMGDTVSDLTGSAGSLVGLSQRLHGFIDPCISEGLTLTLPFVHPYDAYNVPLADWAGLHNILMTDFGTLKHANAATTPVEISIFAWAENMELSVPTTVDAGSIAPQAGDEYSGKISGPASAVASAAGALSKVPLIGPYARATQMIAQTGAAIAHSFGYCRPSAIGESSKMAPQYTDNLVNTDVEDNSTKLTLDSRQELSIDPKTFGLNMGDELSINYIAGIPSYYLTYSWSVASAPGTKLFETYVSPQISNVGTSWFPTALSFATVPFSWWRGSLRYTFQIVCSQHHKGRLRIVYDPVNVSSLEANVTITRIVDIAEERDFTVVVPYSQPQHYLPMNGAVATSTGTITGGTLAANSLYNGVLSVSVLNTLTSPNSVTNNDIYINVYISACDDLQVAVPLEAYNTVNTPTNSIVVQSGEEEGPSHPDECEEECLREVEDTSDKAPLVYFGEAYKSFRPLLKRYSFNNTYLLGAPTVDTMYTLNLGSYPLYRGLSLRSIGSNTVPQKANFSNNHLMHYLMPAFLGVRGSVRNTFVFNGAEKIQQCAIQRSGNQAADSISSTVQTVTSMSTCMNTATATMPKLIVGGQVFAPHRRNMCGVEVPYFNNKKFALGRNLANTSNSMIAGPWSDSIFLVIYQRGDSSTIPTTVSRYVATGEDFQLFWFQGGPPMNKTSNNLGTPA